MRAFKFSTLICAVLFMSALKAEELICTTAINTEVISQVPVALAENAKVVYEELEGYRLMVKNYGQSKFELEIFEENTPSRGYASGYLRTGADEISWANWSREILIETSCKLDIK